jgi:polar amino acid transport system permease protein
VRYDWRFDLVLGNLGFLARGVGVTVGVCLLAFVLAFLIGLFVAFARLSRFRLLRIAGQIYVDLIRSTPILIQLVWIFYALPILTGISFSLLETGVLGLGLYGSAYLAEIFRGGINSISEGQFEAGRAIGLTTPQLWRRIILPQALARMLPPITSTLITLVKESALLSVIGVPELMFQMLALNTTTFRSLEIFTVGSGIYFLLTYPIALGMNYLYRRRLAGFA